MPRKKQRSTAEQLGIRSRPRWGAPESFWTTDPDVPPDLRKLPRPGDPRIYVQNEASARAGFSPERIAEEQAAEDHHRAILRRREDYLRDRFGAET